MATEKYRDKAAVETLLAHGADRNARDKEDNSAPKLAAAEDTQMLSKSVVRGSRRKRKRQRGPYSLDPLHLREVR